MSVNYGSIGTILGHELTHAFDDKGGKYDKTGRLKQWWDNDTLRNFDLATTCMVDQYSSHSHNVLGIQLFVDGNQTLNENIADNGGLRLAFNAYKKWIEQNGEEKLLPLLGLSNQQLFFVSFAQNWCMKSTDDHLLRLLLNDEHSPSRSRVIKTLSNSVEFAQAFGCPLNSPMNPITKCKVW